MAKVDWSSITREDVIKAIKLFLCESPEYPSPRSTFLIYDGKKLPAKHIRGMAYKVAHHQEVSKEDFAGGMETVRFFGKLGFEIIYMGKTEKAQKSNAPEKREATPIEEHHPKQKDKPETEKKNIQAFKSKYLEGDETRLKISSKAVIEQKNALQLILNKMFDGDIVCEKTYNWLKTPDSIKDEYIPLVEALTAYRGDKNFTKKNVVLRCDFVCERKRLIIEYDERQHFTQARKISLEAYRDIPLCYPRELWIKACTDIQAKDTQPANRDEIRAYYDSTRDIEAAKHGYTLVRIMHGQIDFEKEGASNLLKELLPKAEQPEVAKLSGIKIAMYLQSEKMKNKKEFDRAMACVRKSDADILVFPEFGWVPFRRLLENSDIISKEDIGKVYEQCIAFSQELERAVILSSIDKHGTIFSVYANARATGEETKHTLYIKHTMTEHSAFELEGYQGMAHDLFTPIVYQDHRIGMTICYDCNHALFSRMYGVQGVDIILNSTGGNVVYDKWYKYNQSRAIENQCYTFVTMGGDDKSHKMNSYVYGFGPRGKELQPQLLNGNSDKTNIPGGIYLYDTADRQGEKAENSLDQTPSENKYQDFSIPVGNIESILVKSCLLEENLYGFKFKEYNIVFGVADEDNIFWAEKFLPLMYSEKLKAIPNKRYVLVCRYKNLSKQLYENQLSVVLKVRAMENFCAVILESNLVNTCYQAGKSRTAQVVAANHGEYGLDLSRMTGPEAIWKNKGQSFKASWRTNFEWLVNKCKEMAENHG